MNHTATYDPADDKIRIYPAYRLPADEYQQLKSAGYGWAPKQECFYAVWAPHREETALQFADEIEDEDKSLVDRAEERADRFETYSDNRAKDADRAHKTVAAIADNIPFGQPILVGHHSERHARRDAKRIEQGMRRAVDAWETSEYWTRRAAGALAHAKYKERADVRARRIKGLEADKRKREKNKGECEAALKFWQREDLTKALAIKFTGYTTLDRGGVTLANGEDYYSAYSALDGDKITVEEVRAQRIDSIPRTIAYYEQWLNHINNRLLYERAMLAEGGGLAADKFDFQVGGQVQHKWGWNIIKRLNKKDGVVVSVSLINSQWPTVVNVEDIKDYKAPAEGDTEKVQAATKKAPICNYPGTAMITRLSYSRNEDGPTAYTIKEITQEQWNRCHNDYKGTRDVEATEEHGKHRVRLMIQGGQYSPVFITDAKRKDPPPAEGKPAPVELPKTERITRQTYQAPEPKPDAARFEAMKDSLKTGVQTVVAPQLFPTPEDTAAYMVDLLDPQPGEKIGELSAGTGNLIKATLSVCPDCFFTAVEINYELANRLRTLFPQISVHQKDFLQCNGDLGKFDKIILNPPFENAVDIKHIRHAQTFLNPGGKLVSLCANGPRQQTAFKDMADHWEVLPAGSFQVQGTGVNVALIVLSAE